MLPPSAALVGAVGMVGVGLAVEGVVVDMIVPLEVVFMRKRRLVVVGVGASAAPQGRYFGMRRPRKRRRRRLLVCMARPINNSSSSSDVPAPPSLAAGVLVSTTPQCAAWPRPLEHWMGQHPPSLVLGAAGVPSTAALVAVVLVGVGSIGCAAPAPGAPPAVLFFNRFWRT